MGELAKDGKRDCPCNFISPHCILESRPIIHTDIGLDNIFIDCNGIPKLTGFSHSLIIPEGETYVKDYDNECRFQMTRKIQCPNYRATGCITEKTDVYCFQWSLLRILTGESHPACGGPLIGLRNCAINTMVDPVILAGELRGAGVEQQFQDVRDLACRCMQEYPMERPNMVDVSKELRRI